MAAKKYDLEDRLVDFAASAALFAEELPKNFTGTYYGNQLLRSGGSSALNFGEAQGANTDKDYIHRATICLSELKESRVNLKVLDKLGYGNQSTRNKLLDEAEELARIIATIIKNKK